MNTGCLSCLLDRLRFLTSPAAYSGAMDLALAFLPWPLIMTLRMRLREKIGVAAAMTMGVL